MPIDPKQVPAVLDKIADRLSNAGKSYGNWAFTDDEWDKDSAEWNLELAFTQLMVLAEAVHLPVLRSEIARSFSEALEDEGGLLAGETDFQGEPYQKWAAVARRYLVSLEDCCTISPERTVTKDLESILKATTYSITDSRVFAATPANEADVHHRIEAVLKCIFPIIHKPRLAKPIKNFEPDTGIPSIRTLIEYKFLSAANQVPKIADELLADTRGYKSVEWESFFYVIYETERFRSETEWRQFFISCGIEPSAEVVVLSGQLPHPQLPDSSSPVRPRKK